MGEETVTKYICDRCGIIEEIQAKKGRLVGLKKAKKPTTWGSDKEEMYLLCAKCYKEYQDGYRKWYSEFMIEEKKHVGEK